MITKIPDRSPMRPQQALPQIRFVLVLALLILLGWSPAAGAQASESGGCACCSAKAGEGMAGGGCGQGHGGGMGGDSKGMAAGGMSCKGMGAMKMGAAGGEQPRGAGPGVMHNAMSLVHQRAGIERRVQEIEGGIRSVTIAKDPATADLIERHVRQVAELVASGGRMRAWDPLFSAIFDDYEKIDIEIERIENGVVVEETSTDPWVTALIRAHATKVDDFLARGPAAVHEATSLPERPEGTEP